MITAQAHSRRELRNQLHKLSDWSRVALLGQESRARKKERKALNKAAKTAFTPSDELEPRLTRLR